MTKQVKAALFDLDGVVFDTEPQYTIFWEAQCREFHPEYPGLEQEIKGMTLTQIYNRYFDGRLASVQSKITNRLNAFEREMKFEFVTGCEDFIHFLRQNEIKTAVVTSSNREKMKSVYRQYPDFGRMFDDVLTSEDFQRSKPDPDGYLAVAERLGMDCDQCVVFEDSINGLKAGKAAEMMVVGLATTNPVDAIKPLADMVICNYVGFEKVMTPYL